MDETTDFRALIEATEADDTIALEKGNIYIKIAPGAEGFSCEVYDRLDDGEDGMLLACLTRGMIEYAMSDPEKLLEIGAEKFRDEFSAEKGFAHKTIGNA